MEEDNIVNKRFGFLNNSTLKPSVIWNMESHSFVLEVPLPRSHQFHSRNETRKIPQYALPFNCLQGQLQRVLFYMCYKVNHLEKMISSLYCAPA